MKWIHNVMYFLSIKTNLIYVSTISNNDLKVEFGKYQCHIKYIQDHYRIVVVGYIIGGLYKLDASKSSHQALTYSGMST